MHSKIIILEMSINMLLIHAKDYDPYLHVKLPC